MGNRPAAALGLLRSTGGLAFERVGTGPVLEATPGGRDGGDIFSAVARRAGAELELLYVGWCLDGYHDGLPCSEGPAIQLLGAQLPDGRWLLLFTGSLGDGVPRTTSLAVGPTPTGPWEVAHTPALAGERGAADACGAFAPSAVVDGEALRVWYLALEACPDGNCQTCDLNGVCTCEPRFSIG